MVPESSAISLAGLGEEVGSDQWAGGGGDVRGMQANSFPPHLVTSNSSNQIKYP